MIVLVTLLGAFTSQNITNNTIPKPKSNEPLDNRIKTAWKELPSSDTIDDYTYCEAKVPSSDGYSALDNDYELVSIYLLTRHGARTPEHFLPPGLEPDAWHCPEDINAITLQGFAKTPLKKEYGLNCNPNEEPCYAHPLRSVGWRGNCTSGQLTEKGMRQLFDLGQNLYKIYSEKLQFIPKEWEEARKIIQVRSTDYWRTFQSAQSLITGYFNQSIDANSPPLKIHSVTRDLETLMINESSCPYVKSGDRLQFQTKAFKNFLQRADAIEVAFSSVLGEAFLNDDPLYLEKLVDVFQSRQCHGKSRICSKSSDGGSSSKCIDDNWVNLSMAYANSELRLLFRDFNSQFPNLAIVRAGGYLIELKRNILFQVSHILKKGVLIDQTHEHFKDMEESFSKIKWFYYSAHDTSISPVLGALDAVDMRWPPYRSNVVVELWKQKDLKKEDFSNFQVRFIYNGSPLKLKWCNSGNCNLQEFLNYLDNQLGLILGWEKYLKNLNSLKVVDFVKLCWSQPME